VGVLDNEFVTRQQAEALNSMQNSIISISQVVSDIKVKLIEIRQDIKQVREDFRNVDNLRPLKK